VLRVRESRVCLAACAGGLTPCQLFGVIKTPLAGLADNFMDALVLAKWFREGHDNWFWAGLSIHAFAGTCLGMRASQNLAERFPESPRLLFAGLPLGWLGLTPVAAAAVILQEGSHGHEDMAQEDEKEMQITGSVELVLEALPQAMLQSYIGISYGFFDLSSEEFDLQLVLSVCMAIFTGGHTLFTGESAERHLKLFTP
jgi:hypothetical protein